MMSFHKIEEDKILSLSAEGEYVSLPTVEGQPDSVSYYQKQFDVFEDEVQALFQKINESVNKGAHMVKLKFYQEQMNSHQGIGDYKSLSNQINEFIDEISKQIEENRHRNHQQKKVLLDAIKSIVEENNWKALEQVKELHQSWIRIGKATEEFDEALNEEFENFKNTFFDHRKEYAETQKELHESRADSYREMIQEMEEISESKNWKDKIEEVKKLQLKWKENGAVPKVTYDSLYPLFKKMMDDYFSKLKKERKESKKNGAEKNAEVLKVKKQVLSDLNKYLEGDNKTFEIKDAIGFRQKWNSAGKIPFKILGKVADEFYLNLEYLFEFTNLNKFLDKRNNEINATNQLKAMRRFYNDNKAEIETYQGNKENMLLFSSKSEVSNIVEKRQKELERKLRAKKMIIDFLSKK